MLARLLHIGVLVGVLGVLAPMVGAVPSDAMVRYRMTWNSLPIATVEDHITFGANDTFKIISKATPSDLAKLLHPHPVNRSSSGKLGACGELLMEIFDQEAGDDVRTVTVDPTTGEVSWVDDKGVAGTANSDGEIVFNHLTHYYMAYATGELLAIGSGAMVDGRRLYPFTYKLDGKPLTVTVQGQAYEGMRQTRTYYRKQRERTAWFAPALQNLPLKVRLVNGANVIEVIMTGVEFNPATP